MHKERLDPRSGTPMHLVQQYCKNMPTYNMGWSPRPVIVVIMRFVLVHHGVYHGAILKAHWKAYPHNVWLLSYCAPTKIILL